MFHDLSPDEVVDYHAHLVGHNDSDTDCFIHPSAKTWRYPVRRIKTAILMSAAQVRLTNDAPLGVQVIMKEYI